MNPTRRYLPPHRALHGDVESLLRSAIGRAAAAAARSDLQRLAGPTLTPTRRPHRLWLVLPMVLGVVVGALALAAVPLTRAGVHPPPLAAVAPAATSPAGAAQAFREGRYADAYGRFAQLADAGDAGAATVALAMVRQGPLLFGSRWSATAGQLRRWSALSAHEFEQHGALISEHARGE